LRKHASQREYEDHRATKGRDFSPDAEYDKMSGLHNVFDSMKHSIYFK
jgi:hypothetical protein